MSGGIFRVKAEGGLEELRETGFDAEAKLQLYLAQYPDLLAGDQIDEEEPRRWLLVRKEMEVPDAEDAAGRWYLDHLFLDQDGIPTLVEVKRSSDTRARREVVAQMLDYAANAVVYWPIETIRAKVEALYEGDELEQRLTALLGVDGGREEYWQKVKTNLQAGRIRLLFVADRISPELRRIVEFLNGQMDPAEVLALEIHQYVGEGQPTLVPRLVGQTAEAQRKKGAGTQATRQWDEPSFFAELEAHSGAAEAKAAQRTLEWARARGLTIWWGKGGQQGSFFPMVDHGGEQHLTFAVWTYGRIEVQFRNIMRRTPAFASEAQREALRSRLNSVPGVEIPHDRIAKRPAFPLAALTNKSALARFLEVMDWMVDQIQRDGEGAVES